MLVLFVAEHYCPIITDNTFFCQSSTILYLKDYTFYPIFLSLSISHHLLVSTMFTPTSHPHYHPTTTYPPLTHPCFLLYFIPVIYLQDDRTPLIYAVVGGHLDVVEWLVTKGADITHGDKVSIGFDVKRSYGGVIRGR